MAAVAAYLTAGAAVNWFGGYASIGKAAAAAAAGTAGATTALVAAGAVGGAVFGFIASGGDLKAALTGALTGAAFAYVGSLAQAGSWGTFETALAHGTVGGAGSELGGGSFKDGFVGAFFAAAVNPLIKNSWPIEIRGALRTLAGGTASRLGGGKFANGATSAAMAFLFNEVLHDDGQKGDGFFKRLWKKATNWHFEGRDALNSGLPLTADVANAAGGTLLPPEQSKFHDNGDAFSESKYIFDDGREAVYDGKTGNLITDPEYGGTYNYINPKKGAPFYHPKNIGHGIVDVIPYCLGGNNRAGSGPSCF